MERFFKKKTTFKKENKQLTCTRVYRLTKPVVVQQKVYKLADKVNQNKQNK